jgi:vacuolar-type H+-ATPase subunit F/Vma7
MARLVVVTSPALAAGFRLAGATTEVARSTEEATRIVRELVEGGEGGIIAIDEAFLGGMDAGTRERLEDLTDPVVVSLPAGLAEPGAERRRARLAVSLRRAVGFRISFPGEERERA